MGFKYFGKGINVITGFDLTSQAPLDNRTVVESLNLLNSLPENRLYEGLTVYVIENKAKYTYVQTGVDAETGAKLFGWRKDISSADTFEVIDNLTSESSKDALSAKQGKFLKDSLDSTDKSLGELTQRVTTAEGEIDTLQTDTTNLNTRLTTAEGNITRIDGDDTVEGSFRNLIKTTKEAHDQDINAVNGRLTALETSSDNYLSRLNTLEGDATVEGSVAKAVADSANSLTQAYTAVDNQLDKKISDNKTAIETALAEEVAARQLLDTTIHTELAETNENIRKDFASADTELSNRISENAKNIAQNASDIQEIVTSLNDTITTVNNHTNAITTLNADSNTAGSVDYKIKKTVENIDQQINVVGSHRNIVESSDVYELGQTGIVFGNAIPQGFNVAEDSIKLVINGLVYAENSAFTVNRSAAVIRWTLDENSGGFELDVDDTIEVDYYVRKASTVAYERVSINLVDADIAYDGDYEEDPTGYVEDIDLSSYNITNYYATIINGVTYSGNQARFDEETGILSLASFKTDIDHDQMYIVMATPVE